MTQLATKAVQKFNNSGIHDSDLTKIGIGAVVAVSTVAVVGATSVVLLLRRISGSVGTEPPTTKQLEEETPTTNCVLFRHLPYLSQKLAWRSLGVKDCTPIHICKLPANTNDTKYDTNNDMMLEFYVKREDLISTSYGGNKVRTLQHQLGVLEARRDRDDVACKQIIAVGSGGSNQVIATVVHARRLGWNNDNKDGCAVNACWFDADEPDLDNTLNM
jgi:hypothetical protein